MKTAKQLKDLRGEKLDALNAITALAHTESRELTPDQVVAFDALETEIRDLGASITRAETAERLFAEAATRSTAPLGKEDNEQKRQKDVQGYSLIKAIRSKIDPSGHPLSGIELEMHQEADKEARAHNQTLNGLGVPKMVLQAGGTQQRDNSVTMPTQPQDGSAVVQTNVVLSMNQLLENALVLKGLGAKFITDLEGNTSFVKDTAIPVATWKPEVAELDKSNITLETLPFAPKRIGTKIHESMQFIRQTGASVEAMIRQRLINAVALGIERAALVGTGTSNEPLGIALHTGVTKIASGANGSAIDRARLIQAISVLLANNVTDTKLAWAINGVSAAHLMATPVLATGSDRFLLDTVGTLLGYPYGLTNAAPFNGAIGTGTALSTIVFGAFSNLYIGQWGGFDLLVDPYTLGSAGQVRIIIQAFADVLVYEPKAFVAITGIKTAP